MAELNAWIDWVGKAEAAEKCGDWTEAKRCWFYAARQHGDNSRGMLTEYCRREDVAEAKRRAALQAEFTGAVRHWTENT